MCIFVQDIDKRYIVSMAASDMKVIYVHLTLKLIIINNPYKIIKICQQEELISLEAILIHKELPKLNIHCKRFCFVCF